jgi:hypothetical protein
MLASSVLLTNGVCQIPNFLPQTEETYEIIVTNRPLVKINGKTFSVLDVQKKMDLFLKEHHPETLSSNLVTYQFYAQNWRHSLQEMIDNELIKMEAEAYKIQISDGDIRQEMDKRFGPNVVKRLDELKLTFEDAKAMTHDEIVVRNMTWYKVWAKVLHDVTPELVKSERDAYISRLALKDEWTYKMATVRGADETGEIATKAYEILVQAGQTSLDSNSKEALPSNVILNVSDPITISSKDLAPEILTVLESLPTQTFSKPIAQKSRSDGSIVYRMFCVTDHKKDLSPRFEEISSKIHETLVQQYGNIQREEYFSKLRKRFFCEDLVVANLFPPAYQPFTISGS